MHLSYVSIWQMYKHRSFFTLYISKSLFPLMHKPSAHPYLLHVPIVAIEHPLRHTLLPRLPAEYVHVAVVVVVVAHAMLVLVLVRPLVHEPQADELRVPLLAHLEAADPVGEAHDLGAAARG